MCQARARRSISVSPAKKSDSPDGKPNGGCARPAGQLERLDNKLVCDRADQDAGTEPRNAVGGGQAIVLGAILDGIPESIVIGASLLGSAGVSVAMVAAVFISNVPESIAATDDLVRGGTPGGRILRIWVILTVVFGFAAALGYLIIAALPGTVQAFVEAFAGGALLTMLGDSMIPEAYERARLWAGLCLVLGFALALGLAAIQAQA